MEKEEKLKELVSFAESLGLSREEIIAYLSKNPALVKGVQADETTADNVCPGMYYYSDGTVSAKILSEKQISGVVGWIDESGRHGLVLGLRETRLPWSSDELKVGAFEESGKENTRLILEAARKQNKKAEAAEWCAAYDFDGVQPGEAFLASREELHKIFRNLEAIQVALNKIRGRVLNGGTWFSRYWSSSECVPSLIAWVVQPSDGCLKSGYKGNNVNCVRCVFAF